MAIQAKKPIIYHQYMGQSPQALVALLAHLQAKKHLFPDAQDRINFINAELALKHGRN